MILVFVSNLFVNLVVEQYLPAIKYSVRSAPLLHNETMKSVLKLTVIAWAGVSTVRAGWLLRGGVSGPPPALLAFPIAIFRLLHPPSIGSPFASSLFPRAMQGRQDRGQFTTQRHAYKHAASPWPRAVFSFSITLHRTPPYSEFRRSTPNPSRRPPQRSTMSTCGTSDKRPTRSRSVHDATLVLR